MNKTEKGEKKYYPPQLLGGYSLTIVKGKLLPPRIFTKKDL